ncbi:MAG: DUF5666 domain-containing protein [Gammaproteobacteria bacterium]|nr:DUF5666 domain-containing protein [Gammaproteobacteria bacterium]
MNRSLFTKGLLSAAVIASLSACNLDDILTETGRDKVVHVTSGVITKLNELTVNGIAFDTSNTQVQVDDNSATKNDLAEGMYVTVEGSVNDDGSHGTATRIVFDNEVEGQISVNNLAVDNTLVVMGQTIVVDQNTRLFSELAAITQLSDLNTSLFVEVSGYPTGDGRIQATRIKVKADTYLAETEVEVKGLVSNLTDSTFQIGDLTVDYSNAQLKDFDSQGLKDGQLVEVKSLGSNDSAILATNIELETYRHRSDSSTHKAEVEGILVQASDGSLSVSGVSVVIDANTNYEHGTATGLVAGQRIEVKGSFDDQGRLFVDKVEFKNNSDSAENELNDDSRDNNHSSDDGENHSGSDNDSEDHDDDRENDRD